MRLSLLVKHVKAEAESQRGPFLAAKSRVSSSFITLSSSFIHSLLKQTRGILIPLTITPSGATQYPDALSPTSYLFERSSFDTQPCQPGEPKSVNFPFQP